MTDIVVTLAGGAVISTAAWFIQQFLSRLTALENEKAELHNELMELQAQVRVLETKLTESLKYVEDHVNRIFHNLEAITERLNTK